MEHERTTAVTKEYKEKEDPENLLAREDNPAYPFVLVREK